LKDLKSKPQILVIQTAFLGDVLLGIPLLKTLRALYPSCTLTLLCRKGVGRFFTDAAIVDEVVEVDKSVKGDWQKARKAFSNRVFDLLICPHESFRTALFVSQVRARRKIGYARFFNRFIFDDRVRRPLKLPEALRQLALLEPLDQKYAFWLSEFSLKQAAPGGQGPDGSLIEVPIGTDMKVPALMAIRNARHVGPASAATSDDSTEVASVIEPFADAKDPVIVMAPGSVWKTKMWTKEGFIETGRQLSASRGSIVVIMGSKDESALCQEIASQIPNSVSLAGRTSLYESAQLLAVADLLVCNDSGAMHLGAAAGVPIVSVFGPTVLEFGYRPWATNATVVQTQLVCRPCGAHGSRLCPLGHHNCMKLIDPAAVVAAAENVW
jgi:heptosyltransferase-2